MSKRASSKLYLQSEKSPLLGSDGHGENMNNGSKSKLITMDANAKSAQRKLQLACACSLLFMIAEVIGGFLAGSIAIMTDAAHLLSDVAGFCISLFAIWIATLPASSRLSFGFQRAEVIGAVTSVLVIWVLTGVLVYAATERFLECLQPNPKERVNGKVMFIVACIGLGVNVILMKILGHDHHHHGHGGHSHGHDHTHSHGHGHSHGKHDDHDSDHDHLDNHDHEEGALEAGQKITMKKHKHDYSHSEASKLKNKQHKQQEKKKKKKSLKISISKQHMFML